MLENMREIGRIKLVQAHELQEALQFLHKGRRGFYARLAEHQNSGSVRTNDRVFIPDIIQESRD